jgi:primosomal replication protein N
MLSPPVTDNYLVIAGQLAGAGETRVSPAGIPISRFLLDHHSGQTEAGVAREARCRIAVMACGEALSRIAACLPSDAAVRVRGFLSRANQRGGEYRLVLHAAHIEILSVIPVHHKPPKD